MTADDQARGEVRIWRHEDDHPSPPFRSFPEGVVDLAKRLPLAGTSLSFQVRYHHESHPLPDGHYLVRGSLSGNSSRPHHLVIEQGSIRWLSDTLPLPRGAPALPPAPDTEREMIRAAIQQTPPRDGHVRLGWCVSDPLLAELERAGYHIEFRYSSDLRRETVVFWSSPQA